MSEVETPGTATNDSADRATAIELKYKRTRARRIMSCGLLTATVFAIGFRSPALAAEPARPASSIHFARDIRPILQNHCWSCHGPDEKARAAGLRLDLREAATSPRDQEPAAIIPGKPDASLAMARILSKDENEVMPPPSAHKPLTAQQKSLLRDWIAQGADYAPHWAFLAPKRPPVPAVKNTAWIRNPVDAFIRQRLEAAGLEPSPEASREVLLRRVTLDLTGLPPSLDELDAFVADRSPDAYERAVDRLLASPRHAERMAALWLDMARYADTNGYNNDEERTMWPWREWVIDAYRRNLPYDQFLVEQLAGDLLPNATLAQKVATGFNRNHVLTTEGGIIDEEYRVEYVADRVHTTATVFLGLSMQCARCHDHKYDPITQREFYQFFAYFNHLPDTGVGYNRGGVAAPFVKVPRPEQAEELAALDRRTAELETQLKQREKDVEPLVARWEAGLAAEDRQRLASFGSLHHFRLDEATGDSIADAADKERKGTIRGTPRWVEGKAGGALEFDGASYVDLGQTAAFDAGDRFSFAFWCRPAAAEPITALSKMDDAAAFRGYDVILEGARVAMHLVDRWPDNGLKVITRTPLPLNEWRHVAVTYDGSRKAAGVKVYIDGKPQAMDVVADKLTGTLKTDKPFHLGRRNASVPFRGRLDDIQIFASELSADDAALVAAGKPLSRVNDLLSVPANNRTAEQKAELQRFYLERIDEESRKLRTELAAIPAKRTAIDQTIPSVMVMEDTVPRTTHLLKRGQYDQPAEVVTPGVPASLPALPADAPANRLGLARWLASPSHPLTSRVAVNRCWEMLFGTGLVETTEDFGVTGAYPTHPELLDWLAVEFAEGPRSAQSPDAPAAWDVRRLLRLLVTSNAYRQSSSVLPLHRERDPRNQLLSRGPHQRLSAEAVRDNALAVSGLLVERFGGPSVKPYQPEGLWEDVSVERRYKYVPDPGDGLYRRTMYTFWKRTCPPPALGTFDAPTRETCTIRRARTNTPLQALVLLNDPTYIEAARKLAERIVRDDATTDVRLTSAFRRVVARTPDDIERETLLALHQTALTRFQSSREAAAQLLKVGQSLRDPNLDESELAAWTVVCTTLLNLDASINPE